MIAKLGKTWSTSSGLQGSALGIGLLHPLRGTFHVQVNFADVADYAFTVHGLLPLTTHPAALRGVITSHFLDPMVGQVF